MTSKHHHSCSTYLWVVSADDMQDKDNNGEELDFDEMEKAKELERRMVELEAAIQKITPNVKRKEDCLAIGYNDEYNIDVNVMIRRTIRDLLGKEQQIKDLQAQFNVEIYLEIVPYLVHNSTEPSPYLSLEEDIIAFLYHSGVKMDLDYYVL